MAEPKRILFVCTGNICRSVTAEGILRARIRAAKLDDRFEVDSAGTHGYHIGEPPDPRSRAAAKRRGYDLSALRARKVEKSDFERFDLILAMDEDHHLHLQRMAPPEHRDKIEMMMSFGSDPTQTIVPDPYYGGPEGFERVLDLLEDAADGLLERLKRSAE